MEKEEKVKGDVWTVNFSFMSPSTIYVPQEVALTVIANSKEEAESIISSSPYAKAEYFKITSVEKEQQPDILEAVQEMVDEGELEAPKPAETFKSKLN